ncbi:MAG: PP2C family protein-serine/threonine phosphatase [Chloroflexota bacterium]
MLAKLADTWLSQGALSFRIIVNGHPIAQWPVDAPPNIGLPSISTPLRVPNADIACIEVVGVEGETYLMRLEVDAMFVSSNMQLVQDVNAVSFEFVQNQDQIVTLHELAKTMRRHLDIEPLISSLTNTLLNLFKTEYLVTLMGVSDLSPIATTYPGGRLLDSKLLLELQALHKRQKTDLLNHYDHPKVKNLLFLPLDVHKPIEASFVFINKTHNEFTTEDLKLAQMVGDQIGAQFEHVQLHHEVLAKTRLEAEAQMARTVQMQLLPSKPPTVRGLDIYAQSKPASQVGGDFYVFMPNAELPTFVLGDVSGKGMPAALLMTMLRSAFKSAGRVHKNRNTLTPDILNEINKGMYEDFSSVEMFATGVVAAFDIKNRELMYSNAGHSPVIYCPHNAPPEILPANGPAMGVVDFDIAGLDSVTLNPNDLFIICTDGFNEAWNDDGEMYGYDRLLELISSKRDLSAMEIAIDLYLAIEDFSGSRQQDDDQTLIVIKGTEDGI